MDRLCCSVSEKLPYLNQCSCQHKLGQEDKLYYFVFMSCYMGNMDPGNYVSYDRLRSCEAQRQPEQDMWEGS